MKKKKPYIQAFLEHAAAWKIQHKGAALLMTGEPSLKPCDL